MSSARGATLVRITAGFVAGSAVGWAIHDRHKSSRLLFKSDDIHDSRSNNFGISHAVSESAKFKTPVPWDDDWDRRSPNLLLKPKKSQPQENGEPVKETSEKLPTATRYLFLIRHGQYDVDGQTDDVRNLTPLGVQQAALTGQRLVNLGLPYTSIVHSSMTRARETANVIHDSLPTLSMTECDLLREGLPYEPTPPLRHHRPSHRLYQESARIEAAFRKYFHRADVSQQEDTYEIIVCHANVIRYFVCRALQLPPEAWLRISLHHGSVTTLVIRPNGRVILRSLGDTGYMPADKVTAV